MNKKYEDRLLQLLKEKQEMTEYFGAPLLVKNLPDCDEKGAMDPRLYQNMKKQLQLLRWIPSKFMKMDVSEKGIKKLREMFNAKKSVSCVESTIYTGEQKVKAEDGFQISVRIYKDRKESENKPVLLYIHGGGFFGGSREVVDESVKMLVEKTGICVVSPEYRLAPENPYPTGHRDCYDVLKWIYNNSVSFGGDKNHIFVAGDSAGGNLAQYCVTCDREEEQNRIKGQLLLYPTLNMAGVQDTYFNPDMEKFDMIPGQKRGLSKMIGMFGGMTSGLETILGTKDTKNDYLNPYTREAGNNPPTFLAVGEHDFLKMETLGYGAKLYKAGVETKMVLYKGFGHAFFDNTGVYPQCEDCIEEMGKFILEHCN